MIEVTSVITLKFKATELSMSRQEAEELLKALQNELNVKSIPHVYNSPFTLGGPYPNGGVADAKKAVDEKYADRRKGDRSLKIPDDLLQKKQATYEKYTPVSDKKQFDSGSGLPIIPTWQFTRTTGDDVPLSGTTDGNSWTGRTVC